MRLYVRAGHTPRWPERCACCGDEDEVRCHGLVPYCATCARHARRPCSRVLRLVVVAAVLLAIALWATPLIALPLAALRLATTRGAPICTTQGVAVRYRAFGAIDFSSASYAARFFALNPEGVQCIVERPRVVTIPRAIGRYRGTQAPS